MSAPVEPVPTLELPSDKLMQWSQVALQASYLLAQRRGDLERLAWSDSEHAARVHDLAELQAATEPAVRAASREEITQWPHTHADPAGEASPAVRAEVARINDRWVLRARTDQGEDAVREAWVSCREETLARGLASEILRRGEPAAVERLAAHVALGEAVAEQRAATQRPPTPASPVPVDRDAMAAHIHRAWSPDVASAVLGCPAWPTLADKLATAQREGHDLTQLLGGITTGGIPPARKPAALASWMLDQATAASRQRRDQEQLNASQAGHDRILSWVDQLDPASLIDRVGALGVMGSCGTGIDTRLLTRFPDLFDDPAHHRGDATAAEGLAGDRERSAAVHQAIVDDPSTPQREDLEGQALGERDLSAAAAARATAAQSHEPATTAVARASVTLTAPGPATTNHAGAHVTSSPSPQPDQPRRGPGRGR